jgi:hypothetical protein
MLRLDDFSNEGHVLAVYCDDPEDRGVFVRNDLEDRRRWASVVRELGCVPAMRGLDWAEDDSDNRERWDSELASDGRKAVAACVYA